MGETRAFNFINSIKGGCGKTTFSIFLAKYLQTVNQDCLILDMDFQGTAMETLFMGEGKKSCCEYKYLNDAVREGKEIWEYIVRNYITKKIYIDTVFADSGVKAKEKLRISSKNGYSPVIQYNIFKGGLQKFLKKFNGGQYKHFILDMPPNADGFSRTALECVMEKNYGVRGEEDLVNLFFVSGIDLGQIEQTIEEVNALLTDKDNIYFDNFFIVLNDNIVRNDCKIGFFESIAEKLANDLTSGLSEEERKKICFLQMSQNVQYSTYCIEGTGLNNIEAVELMPQGRAISEYIPEIPFLKYANIETDFVWEGVGILKSWLSDRMLLKK